MGVLYRPQQRGAGILGAVYSRPDAITVPKADGMSPIVFITPGQRSAAGFYGFISRMPPSTRDSFSIQQGALSHGCANSRIGFCHL